jgi:hypothetical protein
LSFGELAVRIALHAPIFALYDFRHERAAGTINKAVEYDSVLGWRLKSFIKSGGFNTLDYGFRSNGGADAKVLPGGVLAVGSSFTAGSEVTDDQSWPAHLEQITGWNVNNGGQGGYQADQIVLLAEQLLPLIRPQIIVVDLIPDTPSSAPAMHRRAGRSRISPSRTANWSRTIRPCRQAARPTRTASTSSGSSDISRS